MPPASSASPPPPSPTASASSKNTSGPTSSPADPRSVRLNRRGRAFFQEVRRILDDIRDTAELHADRRRFRGR